MTGTSKPARILLTTDTVGGVWNYTVELCKSLIGEPLNIYLAAVGTGMSPQQLQQAAAIPSVRDVFDGRFKLEWMEEPWADVDRAGRWLQKLERRVAPDLIHLNTFAHGALPFNAPVLLVAHSCVFSWFDAVLGQSPPDEWTEYRRRVSAGLAGAHVVTAPSRTMLNWLRRFYGPFTPGPAVYNGRDPAQFAPAAKQPQIFSIGRIWDEAKNIGMLEQCAPDLRWPVKVAGSSRHPNGGRVKLDSVEMLGELSENEVARELSRSAIYALPARYEPFGLSVLEAALSGCALVLGDIPTLREIWQDAAFFVDPDDARAFTDTVNTLCADQHLREESAARAHRHALRYSQRAMATEYKALYRSLLSDMRFSSEPAALSRGFGRAAGARPTINSFNQGRI